jgi:hypothetical protein
VVFDTIRMKTPKPPLKGLTFPEIPPTPETWQLFLEHVCNFCGCCNGNVMFLWPLADKQSSYVNRDRRYRKVDITIRTYIYLFASYITIGSID